MFQIIILVELLIFLYAFSDDISLRIAHKKVMRKKIKETRKKIKQYRKEKGSDVN